MSPDGNAIASTLGKSPQPDSGQAWLRLAATMLISTIGGVGMWSVVVALPPVQAEFAVPRAQASLPFTLAMVGFALAACSWAACSTGPEFWVRWRSAPWRSASGIWAPQAPAASWCSLLRTA